MIIGKSNSVSIYIEYNLQNQLRLILIFLGTIDVLASRKNSSSTDSCISAHSRSGSESAGGGVMHDYCLR